MRPAKVSGDVIRDIHDREPPVIDLPGRQLKRVDWVKSKALVRRASSESDAGAGNCAIVSHIR
jgi:hypothetical protein